MQKLHIAFDVDGTLRKNSEERHRTEIEPNDRILRLLADLAHSKNVTIHVWSNRGPEYAWSMVNHLELTAYVKERNCHLKLWQKMQDELMAKGEEFFRPDIAFDDQQRFDGADKVIIVREK